LVSEEVIISCEVELVKKRYNHERSCKYTWQHVLKKEIGDFICSATYY